ncbi:CNH domain-containing protein [Entamoeba marina]
MTEDLPIQLSEFIIDDANILSRLTDSTNGASYGESHAFNNPKKSGVVVIRTKHGQVRQFILDMKTQTPTDQLFFAPKNHLMVTLQKRFYDYTFERICIIEIKKQILIACFEEKKKMIHIAFVAVHTCDTKVTEMCFVGKLLLLVHETRLEIISIFDNALKCNEVVLNQKCPKARIIRIDSSQCVVHCGNEAFHCTSTTITQLKIPGVQYVTYSEPFLFVLATQGDHQSLAFYTHPLESDVVKTVKQTKVALLEDVVTVHPSAALFISSSRSRGYFFVPKNDWFFKAINSFYFEAALKFCENIPNFEDDSNRDYIRITRLCYCFERLARFYTDSTTRTIAFLSETFYQLQESHCPVKILLGVFVHIIFKDFVADLYDAFVKWFPASEWQNDLADLPCPAATKLALKRLLRGQSTATNNGKNPPRLSDEIENRLLNFLAALLYQLRPTFYEKPEDVDDPTKNPINKEDYKLYLTSFLLILHKVNPRHDAIKRVVSQTDYLISEAIIDSLTGNALIDYYINMNYLDGIFNMEGINLEVKKRSLGAVATTIPLTNITNKDVENFDRKAEIFLKEVLERNRTKPYDQQNTILGNEVFSIFGGRKMKVSPDVCVAHIKTWTLHDTYEHKNELRLRLCVNFLRTLMDELHKASKDDVDFDTKSAWVTERTLVAYLEYFEFVSAEKGLPEVPSSFVTSYCILVATSRDSAKRCFSAIRPQLAVVYHKVRGALALLDSDEDAADELRDMILHRDYPHRSDENSSKFTIEMTTVVQRAEREIIAFLKNSLDDVEVNSGNYRKVLRDNLDELRANYAACRSCATCATLGVPCNLHKKCYRPFVLDTLTTLYSEAVIYSLVVFDNEKFEEMYRTMSKACGKIVPDMLVAFFISFCQYQTLKIGSDIVQGVKDIISLVEDAYFDGGDPDGELANASLKVVMVPLVKYLKEYYDANVNVEYSYLIDCYLKYSKIGGNDELNATEELINAMAVNVYAEKISKTQGLSWRLQCRVNHHISRIDGLESYYNAFLQQFISEDEKSYIKEFIDDMHAFVVTQNASIAVAFDSITDHQKYIDLIRQRHRPFACGRKNCCSEIVLHCICQQDTVGMSPLLNVFIAKMFEQKTYTPALALEIFIRFFPVVPLVNTQSQRDWINNQYNSRSSLADNKNLFSLIFDSIKSTQTLVKLIPAIRYYSMIHSHLSYIDATQQALSFNLYRKGYTIKYNTKCKSCGSKITSREPSVVKNGEFYHERCAHLVVQTFQ